MNSFLIAAVAALSIGLTACGGGGSSIPAAGGSSSTQPASTGNGSAKMVINIPAKTSVANHVGPKYISASTQSMTIGLVSGGKTTNLATANLTPTSPNCSVVTGGVTQCNVTLVTAAGTDIFALSMYDATNGKGNLLSTGEVSATLTAGANTTVAVDLDGVPASLAVVLSPATLSVGTASSTGVFVQASDADGNLIIGPGGFASPIALAISGDTYSTLSLSATSVTSPGQVVTLSYNGGTNVGSTITPSMSGVTATAATFAGSGGAITYIAPTLTATGPSYTYPYSITALPNNSAAFLLEAEVCCYADYYQTLGVVNISGAQSYFTGDTSDPFNPGTATSEFATSPGVKVVPGMNVNLNFWGYSGSCCSFQFHQITSDSSGNVYYGATFTSTAATDGCGGGGGTLTSGTIGKLNPSAGTTVEKVLKGVPFYLHTDSSGNIWFIETSGTCNGTALLSSGYGIGELASNGTLKETDFGTAGITGTEPSAMSITPDGSEMYIADYSGTVTKIATASLSSPVSIPLVNTMQPLSIGTAPDGTTLWFADCCWTGDDLYYFGYVPGSKAFSSANLGEAIFPETDSYSYDVAYADGSFFGGNDENGYMRITGATSGSPQYEAFPSLYYNEPVSVSAGSGYIWGADWEYGTIMALQYGAMSTATQTMITHRLGTINTTRRNPKAQRRN